MQLINAKRLFISACILVLGSIVISLWQLRHLSVDSIIAGEQSSWDLTLENLINAAIKSSSTSSSSRRHGRILCLIVTHPGNYKLKAEPVHNTWARKCDKHVFVGSHSWWYGTPDIPIMKLPIKDIRENLWKKTWMSFTLAGAKFGIDKFDFFLKADDDTFVLVDNLRLLLRRVDPRIPALLGRRFAPGGDRSQSYMSGGAGYVLTSEAVRLLAMRGVGRRMCQLEDTGPEDFVMGRCLSSLGVKHLDTRDEQKLETFHPLRIGHMIGLESIPTWMYTYCYYKLKVCRRCISKRSVTFHYVDNMYEMELMLHHLLREMA